MPDIAASSGIGTETGAVGIVDFAPEHLAAITDFWVASWAKTLPAIDFDARRPWLHAHLTRLAADGVRIRVVLDEGACPAGFVTVDPTSGHIDQVCVSPPHWGGGLANALIAEAKRLSPARLSLDVNADNPRAIAFYVRNGFRETGRGTNPVSGLPIIAMTWDAYCSV